LSAASSTTPAPLILQSTWRSWPLLPNKAHPLNKRVIVSTNSLITWPHILMPRLLPSF
jgi:hypothetical protein